MSQYLQPSFTQPLPRSLNLTQFIQTVIAGVSAIAGHLVRPRWQIEPPKQPDLTVNWIAFGIDGIAPDANSYVDCNSAGQTISQRHEVLDVGCSIYGPNSIETYGLLRDGFQIPNNREALSLASMAFVEVGPARHIPDLVNERFINRITASIFLRREIQRRYPIVSILSSHGTIHTVTGNEQYLLDWNTQNDET